MANEVSIINMLQVRNGDLDTGRVGQAQVQFDQSAPGGGVPGTISVPVGPGGVDVDFSALTATGWVRLQNLDDTNFVIFGPKSGGVIIDCGRLVPNGGSALFYLETGVTLRLEADTAPCLVQILGMER